MATRNRGWAHRVLIGMHRTIGAGVHVDSLAWTVSNGTNTYTGSIDVSDEAGQLSPAVEFIVGGVPAGSGYVVQLSGADSDGDPCSGTSAPVTVMSGATSAASVLVTCTAPTDACL